MADDYDGQAKFCVSSITRLQPQLRLRMAMGERDMFADVMTGLKELRQDMTKRINIVEQRSQQGQEMLRDELADGKSQLNATRPS